MNENGIDKLNIGLIFCSLLMAVLFPFELFLFSYAVLGPIHYLTEINWLHQKKYFVKTNYRWMLLFVCFSLLITLLLLFKIFPFLNYNFFDFLIKNAKIFVLTGFVFSLSLLFLKKTTHLIFALGLSFLVVVICKKIIPTSFYFIGVFLPTIIHVYFFTLAFMLYGSLKSKSNYGFLAIVFLLFIPFIIAFLPLNEINYTTSHYILKTYDGSGFKRLNQSIATVFRFSNFNINSIIGIKIQIFIAFAYTYHYLNWFSKTSIIGWKKNLPKQKIILILFIWISSISIYLYDYNLGLIALLFLSLLHVYLEFPLNLISIKESFFLLKKKRN